MIEEAREKLGLPTDSGYCEDVLQIHVKGPEQPNLTLVDLPGLFHTSEVGQAQDTAMVRRLVESYMRGPRTIVLAIVTAKNDAANQLVLTMVNQTDPKGLRTLGVITKPDKLERDSGMEQDFLKYARNEQEKY